LQQIAASPAAHNPCRRRPAHLNSRRASSTPRERLDYQEKWIYGWTLKAFASFYAYAECTPRDHVLSFVRTPGVDLLASTITTKPAARKKFKQIAKIVENGPSVRYSCNSTRLPIPCKVCRIMFKLAPRKQMTIIGIPSVEMGPIEIAIFNIWLGWRKHMDVNFSSLRYLGYVRVSNSLRSSPEHTYKRLPTKQSSQKTDRMKIFDDLGFVEGPAISASRVAYSICDILRRSETRSRYVPFLENNLKLQHASHALLRMGFDTHQEVQ
jgi:hypothetical protein